MNSLFLNKEEAKVRGEAISVDVMKSEDWQFDRMSIETLNGAKVESPSGRMIPMEKERKNIEVKVIFHFRSIFFYFHFHMNENHPFVIA